ncbi:MAG TPA: type I-C CRISPR-associated protein Cas7/Csd2 [Verrucomicrobiae bacterium]|nr:type I-C CRISPR-associated protein Cas7/Csd2 [Verrucomicrobiae bacterium]
MNNEIQLHHKLITLPAGKRASDFVAERHDIVFLFDCAKSNPNGDPDTGNMPRVQPDSLKGLVTDVCQKRKARNFFSLYNPDGTPRPDATTASGYQIFIRENAVLQESMESPEIESFARKIFAEELGQKPEAWDAKGKKKGGKGKNTQKQEPEQSDEAEKEEVSPADEFKKQAYRAALLRTFFDLRAFGGVISTEGPLKGSFYGQVRGPIQFTFAESLDKVLQLDSTITRCAIASVKEKDKQQKEEDGDGSGNRTMGRKHGIDYGLYRCHIHFSPAFAAKTGFTYYDLDNFLFALGNMFRDDPASGRFLRVVGLVDFQHQSALGNAPAHKLFELVEVKGKKKMQDGKEVFESSASEFPRAGEAGKIIDYHGSAPGALDKHAPVPGFESKGITARQIIWEIPEVQGSK